jgi:hypothetical protein
MRFLSLVLTVAMFASVGCGDDTSNNNNNNNNNNGTDVVADSGTATDNGPAPDAAACTADCNGALSNNPQALCSVYDAMYSGGNVTCNAANCTLDTSACTTGGNMNTVEEFEPCTDNCKKGLECVDWSAGVKVCIRPCTGEGDSVCGENVCYGVGDQDQDGVADVFACLKGDAQLNGVCLDNLSICAEGQGECQWTDLEQTPQGNTPTEFRCKINCDTDADCSGGNACLPNSVGKVTVQQVNGAQVPCQDDAACEAGFECINLTTGQFCAKFAGWCGTTAVPCGEAMTEEGLATCVADPATDCSMSGSGLCGVSGATGDPADILCIPLDATGAKSICIGFCGGEDGNATLDCGQGYQCIRPADSGVLNPETQKDAGGNPISCTLGNDTPCDAANEYKCVTGPQESTVCGRPFKLCQKL